MFRIFVIIIILWNRIYCGSHYVHVRYTCLGQSGSHGSHEKYTQSTFGGACSPRPEVPTLAVQSSCRAPSCKAPIAASAFGLHGSPVHLTLQAGPSAFACQFSDSRPSQPSLPHRSGLGLGWAPCHLRYTRCLAVCSQGEALGDLAPTLSCGSGNILDLRFYFVLIDFSLQ